LPDPTAIRLLTPEIGNFGTSVGGWGCIAFYRINTGEGT